MYLILNYKTYDQAVGEAATNLTKLVNIEQSKNTDVSIVITPQTPDIFRIREEFPEIKIWAQHIDPVTAGKHTGWESVQSVIMAGATGTLLNHSEHQVDLEFLKETIPLLQKYQLEVCAIAADIETAKQLIELKPDFIAFEPPELIGSKNSLIDTDIDLAKRFIKEMKESEIPLLLGAGVRDGEDVKDALNLGFSGVLLASGFVKADNSKEFLSEILQAYS